MDRWNLPHHIAEYINHLLSIVGNIVNNNQNSLSALDVRYIGYFYYVFPLHLNTYRRLFSEVINPKLSQLIVSVDKFICLISDITSFKEDLNGVSTYLKNVNPAHELLKLIEKFSGDDYAQDVKRNIEPLIKNIELLSPTNKYEQIIWDLRPLAGQYNQRLEKEFKYFKSQVEDHKTSLETNIKKYIGKINETLTSHSSCVQELSKLICDNLTNFNTNYGKLGQFNFENYIKLMKACTIFQNNHRNHFRKIFDTHKTYKECSTNCFLEITTKLMEFICDLYYFSEKLDGKILQSDLSKLDTIDIDQILTTLKRLKEDIDNFLSNMKYVQDLQKIGGHIKEMKSALKQVKDNLVDEGAKTYIEGLKDITITQEHVKSRIEEIKNMNDSVIDRLKIATHTIDFKKSLESEIKSLNGLTFTSYDILEFLINYGQIKEKLEKFQSQITSKHDNVTKEIEKFKQEIQKVAKDGVTCEEKTPEEKDHEDPISKVEPCINVSIYEVKKFIRDSLADIEMLKASVGFLRYNKNLSATYLNEIKSKVGAINGLSEATHKLAEAEKQLKEFLQLQKDTRKLIGRFSRSGQYYDKLDEIISHSDRALDRINSSIKHLNAIKLVDPVINHIKSYNHWFQSISAIINKFKVYVIRTLRKLVIINKNLCQIKTLICQTIGEIRLDRLKDYMKILKQYLTNIRNDFDVITKVIDMIKKESRHIDTHKRVYERLEKYIHCHICYIKCNKDDNVLKESVVKHLGEIKDKINEILMVIKHIIDFKNSECIKSIESKLICVESSVSELECAISGVARNLILCTLLSLGKYVIDKGSCIGVAELDKKVVSMYGVSNVIDYKVVINRLHDSAKKIDQILQLNINIYWCKCIHELQWTTGNSIDLRYINIKKIIEVISSKNNNDDLNLKKIKRLTQDDIKDNHFCLCMVFKYILYPQIINLTYLMSKDLQTLSTISRKYDSYTQTYFKDLSQFFIVCVELLYKLSLYILLKFKYSWTVGGGRVDIKCFCTYSHDPSYYSVISLILVISSLIENMWTMDPETLSMSINRLSLLYSQLEIYDLNSTTLKPVCCNPVYSLLVNKECKPAAAPNKCCCCWCVTCYNLGIILIYMCLQFKLFNAMGGKKDIYEKWINVEKCDCTCAQNQEKGICCVFKLAIDSQLTCSEELQKKLEECKGDNGCAQLLKKVKDNNCKLLLLGCECNCTNGAKGESQVKVKIVSFKNLDCSPRVAVVVFCKCAQTPKPCCCLTELIDKLKQKLTSLCNGDDCCCKELQSFCEKICSKDCCEKAECPCKELKEKLTAICEGAKKDCGNGNNCLCKQIKEKIGNCLTKCAQGTCECNKGPRKCVCCKVVAHSVKILARACRANVLEPYKRIAIYLITSSKDKKQIMKSILETVIDSVEKKISLIKISHSSYPDSNTGVKDVTTVRNWGHDTQNEHYVTFSDNNPNYPEDYYQQGTYVRYILCS